MSADLLVVIAVLCITAINRHSLIFLFAYIATEIPFHLNTNPVYDSVVMAVMFALLGISFSNISKSLRFALIAYSIVFWFAGFDYAITTQETVFYDIFPYSIKAIDFYVIINLITKGEQWHGAYNRPLSRAWFQRLAGL